MKDDGSILRGIEALGKAGERVPGRNPLRGRLCGIRRLNPASSGAKTKGGTDRARTGHLILPAQEGQGSLPGKLSLCIPRGSVVHACEVWSVSCPLSRTRPYFTGACWPTHVTFWHARTTLHRSASQCVTADIERSLTTRSCCRTRESCARTATPAPLQSPPNPSMFEGCIGRVIPVRCRMHLVPLRATTIAAIVMLTGLAPLSASGDTGGSLSVIQFGYASGDVKVNGTRILVWSGTNLTMNTTLFEADGFSVLEINEVVVLLRAPSNGTDRYPLPMISLSYDTLQIVRNMADCRAANTSVGFACVAPFERRTQHVIEIRFLRLLEYRDENRNEIYDQGEDVSSQVNLADPGIDYGAPLVAGLDGFGAPGTLPLQIEEPDVCCGNHYAGWVGQKDPSFDPSRGLVFSIGGRGPVGFSVLAYQWFSGRTFQGVWVTPMQLKLEFRIAGYPFAENDTRLAMELNMTSFARDSESYWTVTAWDQGQNLTAGAENTTAVFAWSSSALADGLAGPVGASVVRVDQYSSQVFLSYPHAAEIQHDPVLGVIDRRLNSQFASSTPSIFPVSLAAFILTISVVATTVFLLERRRR